MIPPFDHNYVIPPHLGNPTKPDEVSPYVCDIMEFCQHFSTSKERIDILKGFVNFRLQMNNHGILHGFQWIDGSFTENVEARENRAPHDVDVVTFFKGLPPGYDQYIKTHFPEFILSTLSKQKYHVDHYPFQYDANPEFTVEYTKYWHQLFSHNRQGVWKGILKIPLYQTSQNDTQALSYLNGLVI